VSLQLKLQNCQKTKQIKEREKGRVKLSKRKEKK
jgi:hypothetical protein